MCHHTLYNCNAQLHDKHCIFTIFSSCVLVDYCIHNNDILFFMIMNIHISYNSIIIMYNPTTSLRTGSCRILSRACAPPTYDACERTHACKCVYACACVCVRARASMHARACVRVRACTCVRARACVCCARVRVSPTC